MRFGNGQQRAETVGGQEGIDVVTSALPKIINSRISTRSTEIILDWIGRNYQTVFVKATSVGTGRSAPRILVVVFIGKGEVE